jgi:hypothetical protein
MIVPHPSRTMASGEHPRFFGTTDVSSSFIDIACNRGRVVIRTHLGFASQNAILNREAHFGASRGIGRQRAIANSDHID